MRGHDGNNSCENITVPCQTLRHVINISRGNSIIRLDANNSEKLPYNTCPNTTKLISGNVSFYSWNGTATINCTGKGLYLKNNLSNLTSVEFRNLNFLDSSINVVDVSLNIYNCSFGSSKNFVYLIDVTLQSTASGIPRVTVSSTKFLERNNAGLLSVVNSRANKSVLVEITNINVINNVLEMANNLIFMSGFVNFNLVNSEISNTKFSENMSTPVALVKYSGCFAYAGKILTFSLKGLRILSNQAGIVESWFCAPANVSITDTTVYNTYINNSVSDGAFVFNTTKGDLTVVVKNTSFVKNNVNNRHGSMTRIISQGLVDLVVFNCSFSHNEAGALNIFTSKKSTLSIRNTTIQFSSSYREMREMHASQILVVFDGSWVSSKTMESSGFLESNECNMYTSTKLRPSLENGEIFGLFIEDCWFYNNNNSSIVVENLMEKNINKTEQINLSIKRCIFSGNVADGSGALHVGCQIACNIFDTTFVRNNGKHGSGAIDFSGSMLLIKNCTLEDNNGGSSKYTQATGSVSLLKGGPAIIQDSRIIQRNILRTTSSNEEFHGTLGVSTDLCDTATLSNSTLDYRWSPSLEKVIVVEVSHTKNFVLENGTIILCPSGYKIRRLKKQSVAQSFECQLCPMGSYSLERGIYR